MSEERSQNSRGFTIFSIPTLSYLEDGQPQVGSGKHHLANPNHQCACWDELIPYLQLREKLPSASARVCTYHANYLLRRSHLSETHDCDCHLDPELYRCHTCGYCHNCGCDLVTTSSKGFHRCSCITCVARCCQPPTQKFEDIRIPLGFLSARSPINAASYTLPLHRQRAT